MEPDIFYDIGAVWALEPPSEALRAPSTLPDSLMALCASIKQAGQPVTVELLSGCTLQVTIRAVGTAWLSAETVGQSPRGIVIAARALAALHGTVAGGTANLALADVSMMDALAHSLRANPRVVIGCGSVQWTGVVSHRAGDYLQLQSRPGLSPMGSTLAIPVHAMDYVRFLEPGDSF